eukprot:GEMP01069962.1.p2 GENE.GEMP01069962.1~~GEMP01069962.1.p2  ORF type:complete len:168 (-),score=26.16 GEMP01069962.1:740-1201(-)
MRISFNAIGVVRSPYTTRFSTPRQAILSNCDAQLVLNVRPEALRSLCGFDRLWILSYLHLNVDGGDPPTMLRPPGRKKVGILSTRAPHRPCGPLGLSAVQVQKVEGSIIDVTGIDLLDGTPIIDIKPYVPYCDSFPDSKVAEWLQSLPTLRDR